MYHNKNIAVVIPTYKAKKHIVEVIKTIPDWIDMIIIVDDKCPDKTGDFVQSKFSSNKKVIVHFNKVNLGVGGATVNGYKISIDYNMDITVKMDSDGQMDPNYLKSLIDPVAHNKAGYSKGNRFVDFNALRSMPTTRLFGNSVLSFMTKATSGYWNIMDPTNGYTAISNNILKKFNIDKLSRRFFFESDMLINLNINNVIVKDVPIPAIYGDEESTLSIRNTLIRFPFHLVKGAFKRFFYKYLIYDFNMVSVYSIVGGIFVLWGSLYGIYNWVQNYHLGIETPTGTIMLSVLPLILGTQFLLSAINIDINSVPGKNTSSDY